MQIRKFHAYSLGFLIFLQENKLDFLNYMKIVAHLIQKSLLGVSLRVFNLNLQKSHRKWDLGISLRRIFN